MFIIKNNYYLYIENTKIIDLNYFYKNKKIIIIYRNNSSKEDLSTIISFRKKCHIKQFKFYIANDYNLARDCKADGMYLSAYNKKIYLNCNFNFIGSAHNHKEICEKKRQGCKSIILSRIFKTSYKNKKNFIGLSRFNLISRHYKISIYPLGGINNSNLLKLKLVLSNGFALLSEIKKKPAISRRLF